MSFGPFFEIEGAPSIRTNYSMICALGELHWVGARIPFFSLKKFIIVFYSKMVQDLRDIVNNKRIGLEKDISPEKGILAPYFSRGRIINSQVSDHHEACHAADCPRNGHHTFR